MRSLERLVDAVSRARSSPSVQTYERPALPSGPLNAKKVCQAIGALMPEASHHLRRGADVGREAPVVHRRRAAARRADPDRRRHRPGAPVAVGAAIAAPDRPVLALVGDGTAMYTIQALWTMAREGLNVVTVVFNNRSYAILNVELERTGAGGGGGPKAKAQLDLAQPPLDFVALANGMGVPARRATTAEQFNDALAFAFRSRGPILIEAIVPSEYQGLKLKALPHVLGRARSRSVSAREGDQEDDRAARHPLRRFVILTPARLPRS